MTMENKLLQDPTTNIDIEQRILVELDALLDTRVGTLDLIDESYSIAAVKNPQYYKRLSDDFSKICGIDNCIYQAKYDARDIETLQHSMLSGAIFKLCDICVELERQRLKTPYTKSVEVVINLWPYRLDEETAFEIENAVSCHLPPDVKVSSIFTPLNELTPSLIKARFTGAIFYNFREWAKTNYVLLNDTPIAGVTVLAPKLQFGRDTPFTAEELQIPKELNMDPYDFLAVIHLPVIGLEWLDIAHYCLITEEMIEHYRNNPSYRSLFDAEKENPTTQDEA